MYAQHDKVYVFVSTPLWLVYLFACIKCLGCMNMPTNGRQMITHTQCHRSSNREEKRARERQSTGHVRAVAAVVAARGLRQETRPTRSVCIRCLSIHLTAVWLTLRHRWHAIAASPSSLSHPGWMMDGIYLCGTPSKRISVVRHNKTQQLITVNLTWRACWWRSNTKLPCVWHMMLIVWLGSEWAKHINIQREYLETNGIEECVCVCFFVCAAFRFCASHLLG